jgi:hypothetical protein
MHIEADDVLDLFGEGGIFGTLEGAPAVGLQLVSPPDALDGSERQVHRLGHGPARPMGGLIRRIGVREGQHLGDRCHRDRRLAGLAASLAQEPLHALLGIVTLPPPHGRAADTSSARDLQRRQPVGRLKYNPGALHVLQRPASITDDRGKSRAVFGRDNHTNRLGHACRLAWPTSIVNPMIASVH